MNETELPCVTVCHRKPTTAIRSESRGGIVPYIGTTYLEILYLPIYINVETTNIESLYVPKKYLFSKLTIPRFSIVAAKNIDSATI